jgi:hypothetical protein
LDAEKEQIPKGLVTLTIQINTETGDIYYVGGEVENPDRNCDQPYIGQEILERRLIKKYTDNFKFGKQPIYTVTTLRAALAAPSRCVGFYYTYEEAKEAIEFNDCDISEEGYYHYCVIEEKYVGVYNFDSLNIWWFKWHGDKKYHPCEVPNSYKRAIAFSMG